MAQSRRTRPGVSSPDSVVRSMQVIAFTSHAAWYSFLTDRRVVRVAARRSTALALTPTLSNQSGASGAARIAGPVMSSLGWTSDRLVHGASAFCAFGLEKNVTIGRLSPKSLADGFAARPADEAVKHVDIAAGA